MRVIINGALGHMGSLVADKVLIAPDLEIEALVDRGYDVSEVSEEVETIRGNNLNAYTRLKDIPLEDNVDQDKWPLLIIDFSSAAATEELLEYATEKSLPVLIATTGQTEEQLQKKSLFSIPGTCR